MQPVGLFDHLFSEEYFRIDLVENTLTRLRTGFTVPLHDLGCDARRRVPTARDMHSYLKRVESEFADNVVDLHVKEQLSNARSMYRFTNATAGICNVIDWFYFGCLTWLDGFWKTNPVFASVWNDDGERIESVSQAIANYFNERPTLEDRRNYSPFSHIEALSFARQGVNIMPDPDSPSLREAARHVRSVEMRLSASAEPLEATGLFKNLHTNDIISLCLIPDEPDSGCFTRSDVSGDWHMHEMGLKPLHSEPDRAVTSILAWVRNVPERWLAGLTEIPSFSVSASGADGQPVEWWSKPHLIARLRFTFT